MAAPLPLALGECIVQDCLQRPGAKRQRGRSYIMRFNGKVALVTAAASGIGRATANMIAREGGRIAAVDNNRERLDATIAEIAAAGGQAHPYHADALKESDVVSVVADAA